MNKLALLITGILLSGLASADTLYLEDGTTIDLPVGSKLYVSDSTVWEFTRFNEGGFDIRPLSPVVEIVEVCEDELTFGGISTVCEEEVVVEEPEETEECDSLTFGGSGC